MEEWLTAGSLTSDELETLVKLTARYLLYDVDQFDHWVMGAERGGPVYVSFDWETQFPDAYRVMWPSVEPGAPAWVVWKQDGNGNQVEVARLGNSKIAEIYLAGCKRRGQEQTYWVVPPPSE